MATTDRTQATEEQITSFKTSVEALAKLNNRPDREVSPYIQGLIEDEDTPPSIKAKAHLFMAMTNAERSLGTWEVEFEAAYEELKKAKALDMNEEYYDEFLRMLEKELEEGKAFLRKKEQDAEGGTE